VISGRFSMARSSEQNIYLFAHSVLTNELF
jgi:hypothetical protein